jgi:hypothetical protein
MARAAALVAALAVVVAAGGPLTGQVADSTTGAGQATRWLRPAASLAIPGAGQLLGHQDRAAVYGAVEVYVLSRFIQLQHDGAVKGDGFRQLAFLVAQRGFATTRRDTVFEYYETMERFTASGQFDHDPGPGLAPETDPATYDGSVWLLARRTFWADINTPPPPTSTAYQRAVAFYVQHAVGPNYQWSWRDASLQQQAFRDLIRRSDNSYRDAQNQLGLLLANHILSALDALISSGLSSVARRPAQLRTTVWGREAAGLALRVAF